MTRAGGAGQRSRRRRRRSAAFASMRTPLAPGPPRTTGTRRSASPGRSQAALGARQRMTSQGLRPRRPWRSTGVTRIRPPMRTRRRGCDGVSIVGADRGRRSRCAPRARTTRCGNAGTPLRRKIPPARPPSPARRPLPRRQATETVPRAPVLGCGKARSPSFRRPEARYEAQGFKSAFRISRGAGAPASWQQRW
jgi:hypothetical protein